MGLPVGCIYVVDGHSDKWIEITTIWISYISKKGQMYNCTVQCQIRHSLQGWKLLHSNIWDIGVGLKIEGWDHV